MPILSQSDKTKWFMNKKPNIIILFWEELILTYLITIVLFSFCLFVFFFFYIIFALKLGTIPMIIYGFIYSFLFKINKANVFTAVFSAVGVCCVFGNIFWASDKNFDFLMINAIVNAVVVAVVSHFRFKKRCYHVLNT